MPHVIEPKNIKTLRDKFNKMSARPLKLKVQNITKENLQKI